MSRAAETETTPRWPEAMTPRTAAAYLDMSPRTFRRRVLLEKVAGRYRKADLDRWLVRQQGARKRKVAA